MKHRLSGRSAFRRLAGGAVGDVAGDDLAVGVGDVAGLRVEIELRRDDADRVADDVGVRVVLEVQEERIDAAQPVGLPSAFLPMVPAFHAISPAWCGAIRMLWSNLKSPAEVLIFLLNGSTSLITAFGT
jgi:hypothetical protein